MLRIQLVDKPSDSDRLCLHGLFSNRPTQSHQWGARTHARACSPTLAAMHAHLLTPVLSVSVTMVHEGCYTQRACRLTFKDTDSKHTHACIHAHTHKAGMEASKKEKGSGFEHVPPEASVLQKWSYHDKG